MRGQTPRGWKRRRRRDSEGADVDADRAEDGGVFAAHAMHPPSTGLAMSAMCLLLQFMLDAAAITQFKARVIRWQRNAKQPGGNGTPAGCARGLCLLRFGCRNFTQACAGC